MKSLLVGLLVASAAISAQAETLTIYTDRPAVRLQPFVEQFKNEKGIDVVVIEKAYPEVVAIVESEGAATTADLIFTKDLVFLTDMTQRGLLQPLTNVASTRSR